MFKDRFPLIALCALCLLWTGILLAPVSFASPLDKALVQSWAYFKAHFMQQAEKVPSQTFGGVISEGQSYAMLMAWQMNDRVTFDKTWQWTKRHMKRPHDHLLAWKWGKKPDGRWGILDEGNATDADQDMAYALIRAGREWGNAGYVAEGKAIVQDLWDKNVVKLSRRYYLTAGPWEGFRSHGMLHQPAGYFAPHVYRLFAEMDKTHPWKQLADDGYEWLEACSQMTPSGLPPNWCGIKFDDETAAWSDVQGEGSRDFGYDAVRIFWRLAQDKQDPRARQYAVKHQALNRFWEKNGHVPGGFLADGSPAWHIPTSFGRAALIAQWHLMSPDMDVDQAYKVALLMQYRPEGYWQENHNYFLPAVVWLNLSAAKNQW